MQQMPYMWNGLPVASDWPHIADRLFQTEQRLQQLSDQFNLLQKQIEELKNKAPLHVEYHFDQLKVNRLEGTLNVGLSPQGGPGIESFEAPFPVPWQATAEYPGLSDDIGPIRTIQDEMASYMSGSAMEALADLEKKLGVQLDGMHRNRVIEDVKAQLNPRVHYYAKVVPFPSKGSQEERQKWSDTLKEKTLRDVHEAFSNYLSKLQQS